MISPELSRSAVLATSGTRVAFVIIAAVLLDACNSLLGGTVANSNPPYVPDDTNSQDPCKAQQAKGSQSAENEKESGCAKAPAK